MLVAAWNDPRQRCVGSFVAVTTTTPARTCAIIVCPSVVLYQDFRITAGNYPPSSWSPISTSPNAFDSLRCLYQSWMLPLRSGPTVMAVKSSCDIIPAISRLHGITSQLHHLPCTTTVTIPTPSTTTTTTTYHYHHYCRHYDEGCVAALMRDMSHA